MQTIDFTTLQLKDGDTFLDVGCGEGRHTIGAYLSANVHAVGVDLSEKDLATAEARAHDFIDDNNTDKSLRFMPANALALPFEDDSFDKVICSEVLEHIPDYQGVLKELKRVLKPTGVLAVSVPRAWPEEICWRLSQAYHEVEGGHIRIFNALQLRRDVERLDCTRYARHFAHALHVPYWWLKCAFWEQDDAFLVKTYHRFLVWDLMKKPRLTHVLETLLNPVLGKSIVMYFKPNNRLTVNTVKD